MSIAQRRYTSAPAYIAKATRPQSLAVLRIGHIGHSDAVGSAIEVSILLFCQRGPGRVGAVRRAPATAQ
jgi:hypothetical protein